MKPVDAPIDAKIVKPKKLQKIMIEFICLRETRETSFGTAPCAIIIGAIAIGAAMLTKKVLFLSVAKPRKCKPDIGQNLVMSQ